MSSACDPILTTGLGTLLVGDSLPWLEQLDPESVTLAVVDPPYGIKKAEWDTWANRQDYVAWASGWLEDLAGALTRSGSAYVMGFSEVLADLKWASGDLFAGCRWLVWAYRNKGNLRGDWGRSHESLLHLRRSRRFTMNVDAVRIPYNQHTRRYPDRKQGKSSHFGSGENKPGWTPHPLGAKPRDVLEIPILNNGMAQKTPHPTQKPEELIRRLVAASSDPGDLVIDPFGGSGTTAVVCELLGRRWLVCEREPEYAAWAKERVEAVLAGQHSLADLQAAEAKMVANRAAVRGG
jgi:site-specific DNA-methyltransferase (adenine-specific)